TIIIAILILLIVLIPAKNIITKKILSKSVMALTGLRLEIETIDVGVAKSLVSINGLMLFNPPGFKDRLMVDMPEIYVDYVPIDLLKGKIRLETVKLDLKELIVVKNKNGELNVDSLKTLKRKKKASTEPSIKKRKTSRLHIDVLELKIGRVIYKDYYQRANARITEFNVNINERHKNIDDPRKLANLILFKALINTSIANLAGFDLDILENALGDTLGTAFKAGEIVTDSAKEVTEKAANVIKSILPFGK
ncbi:AsmA family protein, partial [Candidatus Omnitrophota bacterium]